MVSTLFSSGGANAATKLAAAAKAAAAPCSRGLATKAAAATAAAASAASAGTDSPQLLFSSAAAPGHHLAGHVEQPARVDVILQRLKAAGIVGGAGLEGQVRAPVALCACRTVCMPAASACRAAGMPASVIRTAHAMPSP